MIRVVIISSSLLRIVLANTNESVMIPTHANTYSSTTPHSPPPTPPPSPTNPTSWSAPSFPSLYDALTDSRISNNFKKAKKGWNKPRHIQEEIHQRRHKKQVSKE